MILDCIVDTFTVSMYRKNVSKNREKIDTCTSHISFGFHSQIIIFMLHLVYV